MPVDMMQVISDLAYPRLSGTEADEVKARAYLEQAFTNVGLDPVVEPAPFTKFPTNVLIRLVVLVIAVGLGLALVLQWLDLHLANLIFVTSLIAALAGAVTMQSTRTESFAKLGKVEETFNISARIDAPEPGKNARGIEHVLLVAHHDTKSQQVTTLVRTASYLLGMLVSLVLGLLFIASSLAALLGAPVPGVQWTTLVLFLVDLPFMIILLLNKTVAGESTGALDNNTAIAILLKLAEHFKQGPPRTVSLTFLVTGAEEWGMHGAVAFWKKHAIDGGTYDPARTVVFNFDMVAGGLHFLGSFGLGKKPYNAWLNDAFKDAAATRGITTKPFWLPVPLGTTDGWIFHKQGCETIDVVNETMSRYTHSKHDTPAVCDEQTLTDAVAATIETIARLEA